MLLALAAGCRSKNRRSAGAAPPSAAKAHSHGGHAAVAVTGRAAIAVAGLRYIEHLQLLSDGSALVIEVPRRDRAPEQLLRLVRYRPTSRAERPRRQVLHTLRGRPYAYPGHSGGVWASADGKQILVWHGLRAVMLDARGVLQRTLSLATAVKGASPSAEESIINMRLRGATLLLQTSRWRLLAAKLGSRQVAWRQLEPPSKAWRGGRSALMIGASHAFVVTDARQLRVYRLADGKRVGAASFPHPGSLEAALGPNEQRLFVSAVYTPPHSSVTYYRARIYGRAELSRAKAKGRPLAMKGLPGGDGRGAGVLGVHAGRLVVQPYGGGYVYTRALAGADASNWCRTTIATRDLVEVAFAGRHVAVLRLRHALQKDGTSRLAGASVDIYNASVLICRR